jgi:hypothetical protein
MSTKRVTSKSEYERETLIANLLILGKRFTYESSLVDGHVDGFRETAIHLIRRNDITDLEWDHITRDKISGFDFGPGTITLDFCFGSEGFHQGFDSVTSIAFLVETNSGIDKQVWGLTFTIWE